MIKANVIETFSSVTKVSRSLGNSKINFQVSNKNLNENSLFICFVGERYNPLDHLDKLKSQCCKNIVIEERYEVTDEYFNVITVSSLVDFCQEAARTIVEKFHEGGGRSIVITGSNGKTTTRNMLYYILANLENDYLTNSKVITTQKNDNNHLGVPFTLFQITEKTKYAIVEFGSNHPGEIEVLCEILSPHYAYTTNIGDSHLEFFGTRKNVLKEESLIKEFTTENFFLNTDDNLLCSLPRDERVIEVGANSRDFIIKTDHKSARVNNIDFKNDNLTGAHNFFNLGIAAAISIQCGFDPLNVKKYAENFIPTQNRSQWIELENGKAFLDAYNANPSSMLASLEGFVASIQEEGNLRECCIVLGDMNELGTRTRELHSEVGKQVLGYSFGHVVFVGRYAKEYSSERRENITYLNSTDELKNQFKAFEKSFKYFFIKGSRTLQLESIFDIR